MDYEKAYKEAHSRAEMFRNTIYKGVAEEIFPDLRESSYDEKIKKELIEMVMEDWPGRSDVIDWIEKQGEQKEYTFKPLPRLLDMIEPTNKAKAYCQKLIDTLVKEGYSTDAKIVGECLKGMNGEDVPMAIMDEKQEEQKPVDKYKEWYDFIRWFVKQRTDDFRLIPSDDDIHRWGDNILNHARKVLGSKSAWNENDEYYYGIIQYIINDDCVGKTDKKNANNWLKSLKDRVQPKQE